MLLREWERERDRHLSSCDMLPREWVVMREVGEKSNLHLSSHDMLLREWAALRRPIASCTFTPAAVTCY